MTNSNKKIVKNYFILALIFLAVVLLVWYICKWYTVCNDYKKEIPVIRGTLNYEITESDFEHYILENPSSVVYMCTASEEKCRDFERDFKKIVVAKNLQDSIIYLNLSNTDIDSFVKDFNNKYNYKIKLTKNYPLLVEFTDGKVTGLVQGEDGNSLSISKMKQFIEIHKIGKTN